MKNKLFKFAAKAVIFIAIFALLWQGASHAVDYKWDQAAIMKLEYEDFEKEPSTDVLFFGASNVLTAAAPAVLWDEGGITSFNLASSSNNMMVVYHQLRYAMSVQDPKLVVIDLGNMSFEKNLDENESEYEFPYRKACATIPNMFVKMQLARDICSHYKSQSFLSYLSPLIRYHERWSSLTEEDFQGDPEVNYDLFRKGCVISSKVVPLEWPDDIFRYKRKEVPLYVEYIEKMIDLCEENDCELMLLLCPKTKTLYADYTTGLKIAEKQGVNFLHFTTQKDLKKAGIDLKTDFYNKKHMNIRGQEKFSRYLARYIAKHYDIPDHSADSSDLAKKWNQVYSEYASYYNEHVK